MLSDANEDTTRDAARLRRAAPSPSPQFGSDTQPGVPAAAPAAALTVCPKASGAEADGARKACRCSCSC
eukprot:4259526-Pleurochrysis_carterae.AAC.1